MMTSWGIYLVVLLSSLAYFCCSADDQILFANCSSDTTYSSKNIYQQNRNNLLYALSNDSLTSSFHNEARGSESNKVYGSYLCQGRLPATNCSKCVNDAVQAILKSCPSQTWAQIWYDDCNLKFSNDNFFGNLTTDDWVTWCGYRPYMNNSIEFNNVVSTTLYKVAGQAASDEARFATLEADLTYLHDNYTTLYTSAQCVPDISPQDCLTCLDQSIDHVNDWCMPRIHINGKTICSSCIIRYDVTRFYAPQKVAAPPTSAALPPILCWAN